MTRVVHAVGAVLLLWVAAALVREVPSLPRWIGILLLALAGGWFLLVLVLEWPGADEEASS